MLQFEYAKNVVGDCRLGRRPENLEMNMFLGGGGGGGATLKKSKSISGILRWVLTF